MESQLEHAKIVKSHRPGYVANPAVLRPSATLRDLDELRAARGFSSVCISESGTCGSALLGLVTTRDAELVRDRNTLLSEVMTSESKVLRSRTSSASRVVTKPSRALPQVPLSLMQTELKPRAARNSSKSRSVALGRRTAGFATYPGLCDLTIFACSS